MLVEGFIPRKYHRYHKTDLQPVEQVPLVIGLGPGGRFIALRPGPIKGVCSPPTPLLMSVGIPTKLYFHIINENDIQICLKIDTPLQGFEPETTLVASLYANH